jgi:DNA topoisomerase
VFKKQTVKAVDLIYGEDVMKLYLCEKPSQGRDVAVELNATKRADGYLMNADGSIVITSGIGHLVEQFHPEQYDAALKKWLFETLPIIPNQWNVGPKKETAKQYKIVLGFIKKASTVIISMDADREGEMIARELLELANFRGKIQRCWLTALDPENIRKALTTLKNNQKTESLPGDNSSLQH